MFQAKVVEEINNTYFMFFYVLFNAHLSIILDSDQLDAHLLYFTIHPLQSSTCVEHYMLIFRTLNCTDAASGIVLSFSCRPVHSLRGDWLLTSPRNM